MIVYDKPVLRRQYTEEASKQGHLHEGKFASINAAGEIALEDNDTMPHGVISEPDGQLRSMLGNRTGASIICGPASPSCRPSWAQTPAPSR